MNINYTESFNFKPKASITPYSGYWQNSTWGFNMPEITPDTAYAPSFIDVILHGVTALTLVNAKADSLEYLKLFGGTELLPETYLDTVTLSGGCEQNGTPTPDNPVNIVCNNGAIKVRDSGDLPSDYTQLNYIESSGTQWIDTGVYPTELTEAEYKCAVIGNVSNVNSHLFGSRLRQTQGFALAYLNKSAPETPERFRFAHGNAMTAESSTSITDSQLANPHTYYMSGTSFKVDSTETMSFTTTSFTSTYSLWLFGTNDRGSLHSEVRAQRVYGCTIWDNGILVRNLIPCRRNSDSVLGMYDTVSQTFFTNAGTGTFTAGNPADVIEIYTDGTQEIITDSLGNTAGAEMLLAVGDYKDTQEVLSGSVTRNIGIKVLDGTEDWTQSDTKNDVYRLILTDAKREQQAIPSTHFIGTNAADVNMPSNSIKVGSYAAIRDYGVITIRLTDVTTLADFKQYLATQYLNGTPVIIVYPLATATTETVSGQFLSKSPVTQTAGSIDNLPIAITESSHTTPTPQQPLDINCNNGVLKVSKNLYNPATRTDGYYISASGVITKEPTSGVSCYSALIPVEPNTTYILSGVQNSNLNANKRIHAYDINGNWIQQLGYQAVSTGDTPYSIAFTTTATTKFIRISILQADTDVQLEVGSTATPYMPYGQIYVDGTTETVEITGKNLFDVADLVYETNKYLDNSGVEQSYSGTNYTKMYIPVMPNTKYTVSGDFVGTGSYITGIYYFDKDKTFISRSTSTTTYPRTYTTPANCAYVDFQYRQDGNPNTWQLELGSTATTYEPYYNGGSALAENLLKVGTYQDVQSVIDGGVTRNVGIHIITGQESNFEYSSGRFTFILSDNFVLPNTCICTHYQGVSSDLSVAQMSDLQIKCGYTGFANKVYIKDSRFNTTSALQTWLADQYNSGNPVVVVYPLATPTTETVTAQPMNIQEGTNNVTITQASMDDLELEVKYKAGVEVTITEIENAQLDDNVEVTIQ